MRQQRFQLGRSRGRISRFETVMRWVRWAGLLQIHCHHTAWARAERNTTWTLATVPADNG